MVESLGLADGIYEDMSAANYFALPRLNFSTLKLMDDCPEQCKLGIDSELESKDTDALKFGTAYHTYVLQPKLFLRDYCVVPKMRRAGKEWDELLTSLAAREILESSIFWTEDEDRMKAMRNALAKHPVFPGLIVGAKREIVVLFTLGEIPCKARIDIWNSKLKLLGDLKTCRSCKPDFFISQIFFRKYDQQMAWYKLALETQGFKVDDVILTAQRKDPGYGVMQYQLAASCLEEARAKNELLFNAYRECALKDAWPSYPEFIVPVVSRREFLNKEDSYGNEGDEA